MTSIALKAFRVTDMNFVNHLQGKKGIEISNKYAYNVGYSGGNTCKGEFVAEIYDKNNKKEFSITVKVIGIFSYNEGVSKEEIHVKTYKEIFPYVRSIVLTLTANAGIPPITIPAVDIESQSIYRFEMGDKNKKNFENGEDV